MMVTLTLPEGNIDLSRRLNSIQWNGNSGRLARELVVQLVVSPTDPDFAAIDIGLFRPISLYRDDGTLLIAAYVVKVTRDSGSDTMSITALDRGLWLSNNQGYYNFNGVRAEQATKTICGDFGIPVGTLPTTGVSIKRKFPGVPLHDILRTLWYQAGEGNGALYHLEFQGNTLSVLEKPKTAGAVVAPKANLEASTITRDGTNYQNTVAVYSEKGSLLRTVKSETADTSLEGIMQRVMTQQDGANMEQEAKAALEESDIKQTVGVTVEGDTSLMTGRAVEVQLTSTGVSGLFWIEGDSHTWINGKYTTTLDLNFKNIMPKANGGSET